MTVKFGAEAIAELNRRSAAYPALIAERDRLRALNAELVAAGRTLIEAVRMSGGSATSAAIAFDALLAKLGEDA